MLSVAIVNLRSKAVGFHQRRDVVAGECTAGFVFKETNPGEAADRLERFAVTADQGQVDP